MSNASSPPRRRLLITAALLAAAVVAVWWLARPASNAARTVTVRRATLQSTVQTTGKLVARRAASVSSIAGGTVQRVPVREGDRVRRGDVLAILTTEPALGDVAKAERRVEAAETQLTAAEQRAANDASALPAAAQATADLADARAGLVAARERLAATQILAPFDGLVATVRVMEGATYAPGTEAFTMVDPSVLVVSADLDEVDRPRVQPGQAVTFTVLAFPGQPIAGAIAALSDVATTRGGTTIFPVTIDFTRPPDLALLPGMGVEVTLVTAARANVLVLPDNAIRRKGDRQYVVVRANGRDQDVEVRAGVRAGGEVEIAAGLQEGDVVVLP